MSFNLDYLLNLPGVWVQTCAEVEGMISLKLEILVEGMNCPHCQKYTEELHQNRPVLVRDLPTFGRKVYLQVPRRQFYCNECKKYSTERLKFCDWKRRHTQRYEANIYERVQKSSIEQIGREEELSYDEIKNIFDHVYQQRKKNTWSPSQRICIDEISMRKGHQDFVTVVSDVEKGVLIEVINSHKQDKIIEVLMEQPLELRQAVKEVSVDMWGGFPKVAQKVFPNAALVIDRFHAMKAVNQDLNRLRKKLGITDRGSKFLLLRNGVDLDPEQIVKLAAVLEKSAILRIAYELKEEFRQIYETNHTVKSGRRQFDKWLRLADLFFNEATSTIRNHLDGICNYFISRTTSGVMEGINNRIKLIKRQGYGFSNFDNFRSRLLACFSH